MLGHIFHLYVPMQIYFISCLLIMIKCSILFFILTIAPVVELEVIITSYCCRGEDSEDVFSSDFMSFPPVWLLRCYFAVR